MFVKVYPGSCALERDEIYLNTDTIVGVKEFLVKGDDSRAESWFLVVSVGGYEYELYHKHNKEFVAYFRDNQFTVKDPSQTCIKSKSPTEYGKTIEVGRVLCQKQ